MQKLDNIMQKEMTRKEFIGTIGFGLASLFGLASILRLVFGKGTRTASGYGASSYGGGR